MVASGIGGAGVNVAEIPIGRVRGSAERSFVGIIGSIEVATVGGIVWDDGEGSGSGGLIVGERVVPGVNSEIVITVVDMAGRVGCEFGRTLLTISDASFEV